MKYRQPQKYEYLRIFRYLGFKIKLCSILAIIHYTNINWYRILILQNILIIKDKTDIEIILIMINDDDDDDTTLV